MTEGAIIVPDYLPKDYSRIRVVDSFAAMCGEDFQGQENALLLPRRLSGHFNLLARALPKTDWKDREPVLKSYANSRFHWMLRDAARQILTDMEMLHDSGFYPELRVVRRHSYDSKVLNYHVDFAPSRIICCYNDPVTQYLRNEDAVLADKRSNRFQAMEGVSHFAFHAGDICRHKGVPQSDVENGKGHLMTEAFIHRAPKVPRFSYPRLMLVGEQIRP